MSRPPAPVAATAKSVPPTLRALLFESDHPSREVAPDDLHAHAPVPDQRLLWVDVVRSDGLPETLSALGANPGRLDPDASGELGLAIEGDWKYLHVRALNWHDGSRPSHIPVAFGVGPNIVLSVHREPVDFISSVLDNEADHLRVGRLEATSFATTLLDRMLTDYLDARDAFETRLDRLELLILRRPKPSHLAELQALRHLASRLRRHLSSQRDLFDALGRPDFDPRQSESAEKHCRLVSTRYSHVMQSIEAARELVNGSFDLYTSRTAESTNEAVYTLTVVTVAMGLAATVAGVLGMNFEAPLFNSGKTGFYIAAGSIVAVLLVSGLWAAWRLRRGAN
ncbi:magnesium transporter CorA family protein [Cognatilysobacter terrigena]|uniref:magnesium transporter CorA family protein n=1 Tax=Cognatilysobacter terrigena TaxID=2488749 RepID=UPI00105C9D4E|nr:CorA family divalent cation transporter [Lysobacter terrigena]